jgi:hypothetical protein
MTDRVGFCCLFRKFLRCNSTRCGAVAALLLLACGLAAAQTPATTTISGTVYDPRTTNPLPLSNVLVYATTAPVAPLPSGVQCMTQQAPVGVVSYAYTDVDGTFTLGNIPQNGSYTLVIQAGKWRRQFPNQTVGTTPLTGLTLNMPSSHTQGDIPMIAIVTGSLDAAECVLRNMGIADTEFTDDNGTVNPGGHIHLYRGDGSSGAYINTSTPWESSLTGSSAALDNYDMVMFPCQGGQYVQSSGQLSNLENYANAGGRLFTTHFSYVYLDSGSPTYAQFAPVADWTETDEQQIGDSTGTISTDFSDGAKLAQWLQNSGATVPGTANQISISNLRTDVSSVIAPTQSWLTLNSGSYTGQTGNPVMQMTFNTPVGAPAASQCGRVMYNDYHVILPTGTSSIYPAECPSEATMSAQEEMLEYALYDLSSFVKPVVAPTVSVAFTPSPEIVRQNDTGDEITVSVTNTSTTAAVDASAVLTIALPQLLTATSITDATGGWDCAVSTLTCSRKGNLAASTTDSVTLAVNVGSYPAGGLPSYKGQITATVASTTFSTNVTASGGVVYQQTPAIQWAAPVSIVYGTPLSAAQLNATSLLPGTFTYSPAAGTVLNVGQQSLNVTFTPNDTVDYATTTASVILNVIPGSAAITLTASANPVFMTNAVSFTASLPANESAQTGTITFFDGAAQIGASPISGGSATFTTTALAAGPHAITASYSGNSNIGPAVSEAIQENIQDFTLAFAGTGNSAVSVPPGGQAVYTFTIAPVNGATLPATVTLTADPVPWGMTAVFSPATVNARSGATNVTLTVSLPTNSANAVPLGPLGKGAAPVALGLMLLPFLGRLRKARKQLMRLTILVVAGAALAVGVTGCSGVTFKAQALSFTVTAASGSLSHSVTPQLTVQ